MFPDNVTEFRQLVVQAADTLRRDLLLATGSDNVKATRYDTGTWTLPGMSCNLSVGGVPLQRLIQLMYAHKPSRTVDVLNAWDAIAAAILEGSKPRVRLLVAQFFPCLPLVPPAYSLELPAVQWLEAVGWSMGTIERGRDLMRLHIDNHPPIGFLRSVLYTTAGMTRRRRGSPDVRAALTTRGMSRTLTGTLKINAVFVALTQAFPDQAHALRVFFSLVVAAGADVQRVVTETFDIDVLGLDETEAVWKQAREMVLTAQINPLVNLGDLLIPVLGTKEFCAHFGNYHRHVREDKQTEMTDAIRGRYLLALDKLEAGARVLRPCNIASRETEQQREADSLLNFWSPHAR
jgi:hypothetical protein